jgi:mono/diheme cytochrome c family protein
MNTSLLRKRVRHLFAGLGLIFGTQQVHAQENGSTVTGATLFRIHCASCHGESGKGDGMVGAALRTPPSDLTTIARKNGGVFPEEMVIQFIDGTHEVLAHGPRAMPVWGLVFQKREAIRKLVDYIREMQQM